jgi:hypothetical protein
MTGNPIGAAIGGVSGLVSGGTGAGGVANAASGIGNNLMSADQSAYLLGEEQLQAQSMAFQYQVDAQKTSFDNTTAEKSEIMRETNSLRDVSMEQRKADNEITKEFIKSIG